MKSITAQLLMLSAFFGQSLPGSNTKKLSKEEALELKRINEEKRNRVLLNKELKEWTIDGITVIALNRKNAIRKIENIKKQFGKNE